MPLNTASPAPAVSSFPFSSSGSRVRGCSSCCCGMLAPGGVFASALSAACCSKKPTDAEQAEVAGLQHGHLQQDQKELLRSLESGLSRDLRFAGEPVVRGALVGFKKSFQQAVSMLQVIRFPQQEKAWSNVEHSRGGAGKGLDRDLGVDDAIVIRISLT